MTGLTRAKITLALAGLVLFGAGVRLERTELRWVGLAFVVAAWLLRFIRRGESSKGQEDGEQVS